MPSTIHNYPLDSSLNLPWKAFSELDPENSVIICSTLRLKRDAMRRLCDECKEEKSILPRVATLDELLLEESPFQRGTEEAFGKLILDQALQGTESGIPKNLRKSTGVRDFLYQSYRQCRHSGKKEQVLAHQADTVLKNYDNIKKKLKQREHYDLIKGSVTETLRKELRGKHCHLIGFYNLPAHYHHVIHVLNEETEAHWHLRRNPNSESTEQLVTMLKSLGATKISETQNNKEEGYEQPKSITIKSQEEEVSTLIQDILQQVQKGLSLDDIGIIVPQLAHYQSQLQDSFMEAGIAAEFSVGLPFCNSQLALLLEQVFQLIMKDFREKDIKSLGKHPYLSKQGQEMTKQIDGLRTIKESQSCEAFFETLYGFIDRLDLEKLDLNSLGLTENEAAAKIQWSIAKHHAQLQCFYELVPKFISFYKKLNAGTFMIEDCIQAFYIMMENSSFKVKDETEHKIDIFAKKEAFMNEKKRLYLLGLNHNNWPRRQNKPLFIKEEDLSEISSYQDQVEEDYFLFLSLLSQAETVILMVPDSENSDWGLPSYFLSKIQHHPYDSLCEETIWSPFKTQLRQFGLVLKDTKSPSEKKVLLNDPKNVQNMNSFIAQTERWTQDKNSESKSLSLLANYLKNRFEDAFFSASQLERYQNCPQRFFYETVLAYRKTENEDGISAQDWGSFIHELLYESYSAEKTDRSKPFSEHLKALAKQLLEKKSQISFDWEIKEAFLFGDKRNLGLLDAIIDTEDEIEMSLRPEAFELSFGNSPGTEIELRNGEQCLKLRGQIDMVLKNTAKDRFAILDYKTGSKIASSAEVKRFDSLQLPIYFLAYSLLQPNETASGAIIWQVNDPKTVTQKLLFCTEEGKENDFELGRKRPLIINDAYLEDLKSELFSIKTGILDGKFSYKDPIDNPDRIKRRKQHCRYCDFKENCAYKERFS